MFSAQARFSGVGIDEVVIQSQRVNREQPELELKLYLTTLDQSRCIDVPPGLLCETIPSAGLAASECFYQ
jgi:hypothetical protein